MSRLCLLTPWSCQVSKHRPGTAAHAALSPRAQTAPSSGVQPLAPAGWHLVGCRSPRGSRWGWGSWAACCSAAGGIVPLGGSKEQTPRQVALRGQSRGSVSQGVPRCSTEVETHRETPKCLCQVLDVQNPPRKPWVAGWGLEQTHSCLPPVSPMRL